MSFLNTLYIFVTSCIILYSKFRPFYEAYVGSRNTSTLIFSSHECWHPDTNNVYGYTLIYEKFSSIAIVYLLITSFTVRLLLFISSPFSALPEINLKPLELLSLIFLFFDPCDVIIVLLVYDNPPGQMTF